MVELVLDDWLEECVCKGYELGIVIGDLCDDSLVVCVFWFYCCILVVVLVYFDVCGMFGYFCELVEYVCLVFYYWCYLDSWYLVGFGGEICIVLVSGCFSVDQGDVLCYVVMVGVGIVLQFEDVLVDVLVLGVLCLVLLQWLFCEMLMYLVY